MDERRKLISLISMSKKAGRLKAGEFAAEEAIASGKARLVIVAEDASDNTKKKFENKSKTMEVPIVFFGKKEELGAAIGKELTAGIAICDDGLAKAFLNKYKDDWR